jgi:hypothetical protein
MQRPNVTSASGGDGYGPRVSRCYRYAIFHCATCRPTTTWWASGGVVARALRLTAAACARVAHQVYQNQIAASRTFMYESVELQPPTSPPSVSPLTSISLTHHCGL